MQLKIQFGVVIPETRANGKLAINEDELPTFANLLNWFDVGNET